MSDASTEKRILEILYGKRTDAYTVNATKVEKLKQYIAEREAQAELRGRIAELEKYVFGADAGVIQDRLRQLKETTGGSNG